MSSSRSRRRPHGASGASRPDGATGSQRPRTARGPGHGTTPVGDRGRVSGSASPRAAGLSSGSSPPPGRSGRTPARAARAGRKPTTPCGCSPGLKYAMVGMLMIPNACDRRGLASTSTLTTSTTPSYLAASFSISGATILHGPHQAAQKSTTTGLSLLSTRASKVSSVACVDLRHGADPFSRQAGGLVSARSAGDVEEPRYASRTFGSARR